MINKKLLPLLLLFSLLFIACPGSPPPVVDPPDPPQIPDPIEYVYRWICEDSKLLSREDCRKGIHTKFEKGAEPTDICEIDHNPPPPPEPFPPKYETYSIHWIGLLPWMVMQEMAGIDVTDEVELLIEKSRRAGAAYIHSFCWVGDPVSPGNQYHQFATPWLWIDGKIDFTKKNPAHEKQFRALAEICKKFDIEFRPVFFMSRYNYWAFRTEYNHNGIREFYSPEAVAIQKAYIFDCIYWLKDIFDPGYDPTVLLLNEPAHYGSDELGHIIADWHKELGDYVLQWTVPERLWFDGSHSEYAHTWFVGPHECPKPENHDEPFIFGREEYSHRPIKSESHGCSTLEGFLDNGFDAWAGSAWRHGVFNEDGSEFGSKTIDGISSFRQANTEELRTALEYALYEAMRKLKLLFFVAFPFDPIKNAMEDYSIAAILSYDWERLELFPIIYQEIY